MDFADKDFKYYWPIIKIPVLILIGWSVAAFIVAKFSMYWYNTIFGGISGFLFQIAVFAFVGYIIIEDHKGKPGQSAWAGALTGILSGFFGAIIAVIAVNLVPEVIENAVQQAVAQGAPADMVRQWTKIMMYVGVITGPLFGGLIGALVSWISGLITRKVGK